MNRSSYIAALLLACMLACDPRSAWAESQPESTPSIQPLFNTKLDFEFDAPQATFDKVLTLISERYYSNEIDEPALYWAAIRGMLRHISPPSKPEQARIWTKDSYDRIVRSLRGKQQSIGIRTHFKQADGSLTVTAVTRDSPAAGVLEVHDRIMRINGKPLKNETDKSIDAMLRNAEAPTQLTVVRDIRTFETTIRAREHNVSNLETGLLPGQVGYARLGRITKDLSKQLRPVLAQWQASGVQRLVLDLRNNGGGVFIEGLRLAELFIGKGGVLLLTVREGEPVKRYVSGNEQPFAMQVAILANNGTASAAESLTAALATNGKAKIVGVKTYGKSTIDKTFALDNGMRVRFIVGAMYTPHGHTWHERGLAPTVEVAGHTAQVNKWFEFPLDQRFKQDRQLAGAWQLLQQSK